MPDPVLIGCCRAIQAFNVSGRLAEINAPVLIVTPNEDIAYDEGQQMDRQFTRSELRAPENVGHSVHIEMPEAFNRWILQFLSTI